MDKRFLGLTDLLGRPLLPEFKKRINDLISHPSKETWDRAHGIILNTSGDTMWKSVIQADPSFPRNGPVRTIRGDKINDWTRVPDQFTARRALEIAKRKVTNSMRMS